MHLKVQARLIREPHDLLQYKPHRLNKQRVNKGVDHLAMPVSGVLL